MKKVLMGLFGVMVVVSAFAQVHEQEVAAVLAAPGSRVQRVGAMGVELELRGVYVLDGLFWFSLRVSNRSVIDWRANPMRFFIRDRKVWRRRARQELPLTPVLRRENVLVGSDSVVSLCYALQPRLPRKGQDLVLEYGERNGGRRMVVRLSGAALLKAKKLKYGTDR